MRLEFIVSIDKPDGATVSDVASYVKDALQCWCKSLRYPGADSEQDEGDPLFFVGETVTIFFIGEQEKGTANEDVISKSKG